MASTAIPANPTAHNVSQLLPKLHDADSDFRYMALNDLHQILNVAAPNFLLHDYGTCAKAIEGLLHTLNDPNGEVQNMAIKCLGPFVTKLPENVLSPMIDKVAGLQTSTTIDASVPALALRAVVMALPRPIPGVARSKGVLEAYSSISRALIPRLVGQVVIPYGRRDHQTQTNGPLLLDVSKGTDNNAIDVLIEITKCFGPMLQDVEVQALHKVTFDVLESDQTTSVLKKKAVVALSALSNLFSDSLLSAFLSRLIENFRNPHLTNSKRKLYFIILGSLARSIPRKFGPYLKTLAPFVLSAVSEDELNDEMEASFQVEEKELELGEVREAALVALDSFLGVCGQDMVVYTDECITAGIRFSKYDPNLAGNDDDDIIEEDTDGLGGLDEEDFEEEGEYDDEDDSSWKVRRCAVKVLCTIIQTRSNVDLLEDGTLYARVAPALLARFKEREESVRLEVLSTVSCLVGKTTESAGMSRKKAQSDSSQGVIHPPTSRKRRRGGSDASLFGSQTLPLSPTSPQFGHQDSFAPTAPQNSLAAISPDIVSGVAQLLKTAPLPTKQTGLILLKDIVAAQGGGLSDHLDQISDSVVDAISVTTHQASTISASSSSSMTSNSLRIHSIQLVAAILETHSPNVYRPHLAKFVSALAKAVEDKNSRVGVEALVAIEQIIKAITPPQSTIVEQQTQGQLDQLYNVIVGRISASDADLEVRKHAISALSVLLAYVAGTHGLLSEDKWKTALKILGDRLKNELTRLSCVKAIETVVLTIRESAELESGWVRSTSLEIGAQLRKASRNLRGASLQTLRAFVLNPAVRVHLDKQTIKSLVDMLIPLLTASDLPLFSRALTMLATFVNENAEDIVNSELILALCSVLKMSIAGSALEALLVLVSSIGEQGVGRPLMTALLQDVGVGGNADLLGKVIGTLLVSGATSVGVKVDDFVNELKTAQDDKRRCLALVVLGEAGFRLGPASPLQPKLFITYLTVKSDHAPLTAAVSLGRAGARNVNSYLPSILSTMQKSPNLQYLLLHSVKEFLQHSGNQAEIMPYTQTLWQNLVEASKAEDNKAIGAECIGRLAIIDPGTYLPQLQVRGSVMLDLQR